MENSKARIKEYGIMASDLPSAIEVFRHQGHRDRLASQLAILVSNTGRARSAQNLAKNVLDLFVGNGRNPTAVAICSIATFAIFLRDLPGMDRSVTEAPAMILGGLSLPISPTTLTLLDRASSLSRACALERVERNSCRFSVLSAYPFCPVVTCARTVCFLFSDVIFVASLEQVYSVVDRLNELGRASHLIACHLSVAPSVEFFTDMIDIEITIYETYDTRSGEVAKAIHLWIRAVCDTLHAERRLANNNTRGATAVTDSIVSRQRAATRLSALKAIAPAQRTGDVVSRLRAMLNPPRLVAALLVSAYFPLLTVERMSRESGVGPASNLAYRRSVS